MYHTYHFIVRLVSLGLGVYTFLNVTHPVQATVLLVIAFIGVVHPQRSKGWN